MPAAQERLTWVGHATVLLELGGRRLLTDPVLTSRLAHLRRHAARPAPGVAADLDVVLLSHLHLDHLHGRSMRRLDRATPVLGPRDSAPSLRRLGFRDVRELEAGDEVDVGGVGVRAVQAVHDGRRHPLAREAGAIGFVVTGGRRVYFAGDTDIFPAMDGLAARLDVALLPVWGWGPTIGPGHLDPRGAARAAALLRPQLAIPIHWGTLFPAGLARVRGRALTEPGRAFARQAAELAPGVEVRLLAPGATLAL